MIFIAVKRILRANFCEEKEYGFFLLGGYRDTLVTFSEPRLFGVKNTIVRILALIRAFI